MEAQVFVYPDFEGLNVYFNLFNTIKSKNIKKTNFFIKFPMDRKVP